MRAAQFLVSGPATLYFVIFSHGATDIMGKPTQVMISSCKPRSTTTKMLLPLYPPGRSAAAASFLVVGGGAHAMRRTV